MYKKKNKNVKIVAEYTNWDEARQVFEQLTGWEYEKTWGNNKIGYENLINYKENLNKTKHKTAV